jgi:catalase
MPSSTMRHEDSVSPEEAALTNEFIEFLKTASAKRYPSGTMKRFNQGRQTAFVQAEFVVPDGLPESLRVGLFAVPRTYGAWIRFANAGSETDKDRDIRGMSIQVSNVEGENLTPGATTQDFVLNSHPVMVAANTKDFLELLRANEAGGVRRILYFVTHLASARIGAAARQNHSSHLDIQYWSTTPYQFGPGRIVKYAVRPTSRRTSKKPATPTDNYLTEAMRTHLDQEEATFDFLVQFHVDDQKTPIEDATAEWQTKDSPYHRVGIIKIPRQRFEDAERVTRGEQMTFNPWHSLPAHTPLGGMNRARRQIYWAMAEFRRQPRR